MGCQKFQFFLCIPVFNRLTKYCCDCINKMTFLVQEGAFIEFGERFRVIDLHRAAVFAINNEAAAHLPFRQYEGIVNIFHVIQDNSYVGVLRVTPSVRYQSYSIL